MGIKKKKLNGQEFEVLEHEETPGFRRIFYLIITVAVIYFVYIFSHSHG